MMLDNFKRVLVLCPHPDDETTCLGTVLRIMRESKGAEVRYVTFSKCEESVPKGFSADVIELECYECLRYAGIKRRNIEIKGYPVRLFPSWRQNILEDLVWWREYYGPDLVFCPSSADTHQDHRVIYEEVFRAFKNTTLLGYEFLQNQRVFDSSMFVALPGPFMILKMTALSKYVSQNKRAYMAAKSLLALARVRGLQHGGCEYAEAFEVIRMIL